MIDMGAPELEILCRSTAGVVLSYVSIPNRKNFPLLDGTRFTVCVPRGTVKVLVELTVPASETVPKLPPPISTEADAGRLSARGRTTIVSNGAVGVKANAPTVVPSH